MSEYKQYDVAPDEAYEIYEDMFLSGIKPHNILAKIAEKEGVPEKTLRNWRKDGNWRQRAIAARKELATTEIAAILEDGRKYQQATLKHLTPENAASLLESAHKLTVEIVKLIGLTDEADTDDGTPRASGEVDGGEIFGDDTTVSPIHSELQEKPVDD